MTPKEMDELIDMLQVESKQPMTIDDLIAASKIKSVTPEYIEKMEARMKAREQKFLEERGTITEEWLNKRYTL